MLPALARVFEGSFFSRRSARLLLFPEQQRLRMSSRIESSLFGEERFSSFKGWWSSSSSDFGDSAIVRDAMSRAFFAVVFGKRRFFRRRRFLLGTLYHRENARWQRERELET